MQSSSFEIEINENYQEEILDYLNKIDRRAQEYVNRKFEIYTRKGFINCCLKKDIKNFKNGIYEIRIEYKGMALRFFGSYGNNVFNIVLLLNKKSQKTPNSEINKALKRIQ
ncbi:MAG: type II toxin-antitoxin system RelE/ParE family toxin [bacterium]